MSGRDERRTVEKLTDERESRPPDEIYLQVEVEWFSTEGVTWCVDRIDETDIAYVRKEKLPCGHPGACVVSVPYIGENKANSCGWCEDKCQVDECVLLNNATDGWKRANETGVETVRQITQERDALREKLKAADQDLEGSIEFARGVAAENIRLHDALKQVGLIEDTHTLEMFCPWCREREPTFYNITEKRSVDIDFKHKDDCNRQQALAAWKEANDTLP